MNHLSKQINPMAWKMYISGPRWKESDHQTNSRNDANHQFNGWNTQVNDLTAKKTQIIDLIMKRPHQTIDSMEKKILKILDLMVEKAQIINILLKNKD